LPCVQHQNVCPIEYDEARGYNGIGYRLNKNWGVEADYTFKCLVNKEKKV
jgi:hypothetical protein